MKFALNSLGLAAIALMVAGCQHSPTRPNPSETVLGPNPSNTRTAMGNGSENLNPTPFNAAPDTSLVPRDDGFDLSGANRTALADKTVYFDFDRSDIKQSERVKLQAAKEYLEKNPTLKLLLEGHCDWRGTAEYNLSLGERRANAAKAYLVSIGVNTAKIDTVSRGSLEAKKEGGDAAWAKDRRVDVIVLRPTGAPAGL
jgi:peptidoglycan-associated lipoprotein